ncbi:MAG: hypothetical protein LUH54_04495 [Firmicutes bacterium]|nr:hypothetical protein [Bacillota bacterium]
MTGKDLFEAVGGISDAYVAKYADATASALIKKKPIYKRNAFYAAACLALAVTIGAVAAGSGKLKIFDAVDEDTVIAGDIEIAEDTVNEAYTYELEYGDNLEGSYVIYVPAGDGVIEYTYTYVGSPDIKIENVLKRIILLGELDDCTMSVDKAERTLVEETFSDDEGNSYISATYRWTVELTGDRITDDILKCAVNTLLKFQMSSSVILTVNGEPAVIDGVTCPEEGFEYFDLDVVSSEEIAE